MARSRYGPVLTILSPPRSGSTALARAFWQHSAFGWYVHEPYDRMYHQGADARTVAAAVADPLDLCGLGTPTRGNGLIIKEMTFQVGARVVELLAAATLPVVVTIRDPRLSIRSRLCRRLANNQPPSFPPAETGWPHLVTALASMREQQVPHVIVDIALLRQRPATVISALCGSVGLPFELAMLSWAGVPDVRLGQLDDEQRNWYDEVLNSTGFSNASEELPDLDWFPVELRDHVAASVVSYHEILAGEQVIAKSV